MCEWAGHDSSWFWGGGETSAQRRVPEEELSRMGSKRLDIGKEIDYKGRARRGRRDAGGGGGDREE